MKKKTIMENTFCFDKTNPLRRKLFDTLSLKGFSSTFLTRTRDLFSTGNLYWPSNIQEDGPVSFFPRTLQKEICYGLLRQFKTVGETFKNYERVKRMNKII